MIKTTQLRGVWKAVESNKTIKELAQKDLMFCIGYIYIDFN